MATYAYRSNMPSVNDTLAGIVFTTGVNIEYNEDQLSLNRFVPHRLDRWVDGVYSVTDLVVPDTVTAQERYNARAEVDLTAAEVAAVKVAVGNGTIGSGVGILVVDDLTTGGSTAALSAAQGVVLKAATDDSRVRSNHTGTQIASTISNFDEAAQDAVAAALAAGSHTNITVTYSDVGNAISLTASGGTGGGATNIATTPGATTVVITSDTGTDGTLTAATSTVAGLMLPAQVDKLAAIANAATANSADATLLSRTNHTDTQLATTISDFTEAAQDAVASALAAGTHTNITVTYGDGGNSISLAASSGSAPVIENITTGTGYTLVAGDAQKIKRCVDTAAQTINITTAFSGLGCSLQWPEASGVVTLDAGAGVTLNDGTPGGTITLSTHAGGVDIIPTGANTFDVLGAVGDLLAVDIGDSGATGRALVQATSAGAAQTTLSLVPGTNVQAYDATLNALAGLTIAANSLTVGTAADTFSQVSFAANTFPARTSSGSLEAKTISDFGASILDDADGAAVRTTIGAHVGLEFQDEGTVLGTAGTANILNVTGAATLSRSSNTLTLNVTGGGGSSEPLASVTLSTDTNLTRTTHANRQIILSAAGVHVIQDDTAGGFIDADYLFGDNRSSVYVEFAADTTGTGTTITAEFGHTLIIPPYTQFSFRRTAANTWVGGAVSRSLSSGDVLDIGPSWSVEPVEVGSTTYGIVNAPANTTGTLGGETGLFATSYGFKRIRHTGITTAADVNVTLRCGSAGESWYPGAAGTVPLIFRGYIAAADALTGCRTGCGIKTGGEPTITAEPSTFLDCVFMGGDSTDTNMQIMHNDAASTCTKVDLGAGFPINTNAVDMYEVTIKFMPGSSRYIRWTARNLVSGAFQTGLITTNMPTAGTTATPFIYRNSGANTGAPVVMHTMGHKGGALARVA